MVWDAVIDQKTPLVCYKAGSDEIVGAHMTLVESKADNYKQQLFDSVRLFQNFINFCHLKISNHVNRSKIVSIRPSQTKT